MAKSQTPSAAIELPEIDTLHPDTIPAKPEREYRHLWITGLQTLMRPDMQQSARVSFQNYNYLTKELSPRADAFTLVIGDLFEEADRVPLLAQVLSDVTTCMGLLYHERELIKLIKIARSENKPTDILEQKLSVVRQRLGIVE
jgi:hypothetical protein